MTSNDDQITLNQEEEERIPINNQESTVPSRKYTDSILGATFNLVNATIGSGVLGLPFVARETGLLNGIGCLILGAIAAVISLSYLRYTHMLMLEIDPEAKSYEDIGYNLYGTVMSFLVKSTVIFLNFGGSVSYLIILGTVINTVWKGHPIFGNNWYTSLIIALPATFMCLLKRMSDIRFISYASLTAVFAFILYLFVGYVAPGSILGPSSGVIQLSRWNVSMLRVLGIITFAFACHTNLPSIHSEFQVSKSRKVEYAIIYNVLIDLLIYSGASIFGYLALIDNTKGNFLLSLDITKWSNRLFVGVFCLTIFFTLPMVVYPCRLSFDNLITAMFSKCVPKEAPSLKFVLEESRWNQFLKFIWKYALDIRWAIWTFLIFALALLFAILLPQIEVIFSLLGSTASSCTSYIFPGLFYLKLSPYRWYHWSKIGAFLMILFGVAFGISITTISIFTLAGVIKL